MSELIPSLKTNSIYKHPVSNLESLNIVSFETLNLKSSELKSTNLIFKALTFMRSSIFQFSKNSLLIKKFHHLFTEINR